MQHTIRKLFLFVLLSLAFGEVALSQSTYLSTGNNWHDFVQRMEIKTGKSAHSFHFVLKPLERKAMMDFLLHVDSTQPNLSRTDRQMIATIRSSNAEWDLPAMADSNFRPLLKHFYRQPTDFFHYHDDDLFLVINPVIHAETGRETGRDLWLYQNTRGLELRGMINSKVGFYSYLADNQARFPQYVNQKIQHQRGAIPGEGWNIPFGDQGYDYFTARGYIAFQATKNIGLQFGQDRSFTGFGERSLLLSDFANNYLFLKINTNIWRFHYQNLYARLVDYPWRNHGGRMYDPKHMVAHTLSIKLTERFQLAFFESVVWGRSDTLSRRGIEPHYLNPVIFYRAVEHHIGDPDKVSLGMSWRWIAGRRIALHGQLYLDDFLLSDVRNDMDSLWVYLGLRSQRKYTDYASFRNKFGFQLGLNHVDFLGIQNLDLALEGNWVRPFTYSHYDTSGAQMAPAASYSHYGQSLAHPMGANFRELLAGLQYRPHANWLIKTTLIQARQGMDSVGINFGSNIFRDYTHRVGDYNHTFLQGSLQKSLLLQAEISWQWMPNMWLDARYIVRDEEISTTPQKTGIFMLGLRINAARREHWF
jgi:hypothetical protein